MGVPRAVVARDPALVRTLGQRFHERLTLEPGLELGDDDGDEDGVALELLLEVWPAVVEAAAGGAGVGGTGREQVVKRVHEAPGVFARGRRPLVLGERAGEGVRREPVQVREDSTI